MNNNLMIFENPEFGAVRSILIDSDPWFVAADVCKALELEKTNRALSRLDDDEKGAHSVSTPGGRQRMSIISESGLYSLILGSRKPEARAFKRWITHEVIPSIRKHGAYMTDSLLDALEAHPEAVPEYLNRLRSENARNRELNRRLRLALPKAEYYDAFVDPADCTNIRTTAKELGVPEKQFTRYLEEKKYLFRDLYVEKAIWRRRGFPLKREITPPSMRETLTAGAIRRTAWTRCMKPSTSAARRIFAVTPCPSATSWR